MSSHLSVAAIAEDRNSGKYIFTPGPASLSAENFSALGPCFGRGDNQYAEIEDTVYSHLRSLSGQRNVVGLQGSASLALEMTALNFFYGTVLVVDTGYYSRRLRDLALSALSRTGLVSKVEAVSWRELQDIETKADWVWAAPVETSIGFYTEISLLRRFADKCGAKLALDATASIGLETGHELADLVAFSSCKGLFGFTGAAFIGFQEKKLNDVDSFYLSVQSHLEKRMTGPYHTIQSLFGVLNNFEELRHSVVINKARFMSEMKHDLSWPDSHQPLLCTKVNSRLTTKSGKGVVYQPRESAGGTVVSHLGEVHLGARATGTLIQDLEKVD